MNANLEVTIANTTNAGAARLEARFMAAGGRTQVVPSAETVHEAVRKLTEAGEVIFLYSKHYGTEVYMNTSGMVLQSDPDILDGAFIAPSESVRGWAYNLLLGSGLIVGVTRGWKTSWRDTHGPVVVEYFRHSQYWAMIDATLLKKVEAGEMLTVHEGDTVTKALVAAERTAVIDALRAGLPLSVVGGLVETAAGLRALCGDGPIFWTGCLVQLMKDTGLERRGWELFSHNSHWVRRDNGDRVFSGYYATGLGYRDQVIIPADREVALLTVGDGRELGLLVSFPTQMPIHYAEEPAETSVVAATDVCDFSCMICGNRTGSASTVCELHRNVW